MEHPNFYENLKEAEMRLKDTIVMYDGKPYYVLCICNHKPDGIFRIYLDEMGRDGGFACHRQSIPYEWYDEPGASRGDKMDAWLDRKPDEGVIRKMMNSPKFNKFRPFPLGMSNNKGQVVYIERSPTRHTQQGLTTSMVNYYPVSVGGTPATRSSARFPTFNDYPFYSTVMGEYPRPDECIKNLNDPEITNSGMAFDRNFAFLRGPVGLLFMAYKSDVVGYLPNGDMSKITLSKAFRHTKEVVDELRLFEDIKISESV